MIWIPKIIFQGRSLIIENVYSLFAEVSFLHCVIVRWNSGHIKHGIYNCTIYFWGNESTIHNFEFYSKLNLWLPDSSNWVLILVVAACHRRPIGLRWRQHRQLLRRMVRERVLSLRALHAPLAHPPCPHCCRRCYRHHRSSLHCSPLVCCCRHCHSTWAIGCWHCRRCKAFKMGTSSSLPLPSSLSWVMVGCSGLSLLLSLSRCKRDSAGVLAWCCGAQPAHPSRRCCRSSLANWPPLTASSSALVADGSQQYSPAKTSKTLVSSCLPMSLVETSIMPISSLVPSELSNIDSDSREEDNRDERNACLIPSVPMS